MKTFEEYDQLMQAGKMTLSRRSFDIEVTLYADGAQIYLSAVVYTGRNYLPRAVREAAEQEIGIPGALIDSFLPVDAFQIKVEHLGKFDCSDAMDWAHLIQEFIWICNEWRFRLEIRGREELVFVGRKSK